MITEKKKNELIKFIYSHEQVHGGFSFSQTTPPTLEDTYFALRLLRQLKQYSVSRQTISYITQLNQNEFHFPKHLYQLIIIYKITHQVDLEKLLRKKITRNQKITIDTISDVYYLILTKETLKMLPNNLKKNEQNIINSVQKKPVKSMEEYKQLIILMKKFNNSYPFKEYATIIQNNQNHDGGFGIVPNSTSYLESTYHALRALKELNIIPINIHKCERFINSCITNIGAFGRQAITLPTLEYSYYAFMGLKIIEEMKKFLV